MCDCIQHMFCSLLVHLICLIGPNRSIHLWLQRLPLWAGNIATVSLECPESAFGLAVLNCATCGVKYEETQQLHQSYADAAWRALHILQYVHMIYHPFKNNVFLLAVHTWSSGVTLRSFHVYRPNWSWLADLGWSQSIQDLSETSMFHTQQTSKSNDKTKQKSSGNVWYLSL